VYHVTLATL